MQKRIRRSGAGLGMVSVVLAAGSMNVQAAGRTLSVATNADFPPYEYCEDQEIIGIDMEIAELIADELGMELEICNMSFDEMLESVLADEQMTFDKCKELLSGKRGFLCQYEKQCIVAMCKHFYMKI